MNTTIDVDIVPMELALEVVIEKVKAFFLSEVADEFIPPYVETDLARLFDELREDLYVVIEYPYVDRVYRDSYYNYYASKHFTYQRDCIRISLFNGQIKYDDFLTSDKHEELNDNYLGYFVLRPTISALFGRSIINPIAFEETDFKICSCKTESLVNGVKLIVEGFPHSSQDGETIKCAETTIWGIMEYFGNKYADYKPALPAQIHKTIERFSFQRQLPSNGLTMDQISFALKEFGFGTRIYAKEAYGEQLFSIIDSYVESGIPIMIGLQSGDVGHVVIAIGKQNEGEVNWDDIEKNSIELNGKEVVYYETSSIPSKYVVQDDNLIPYRLVSLDSPGSHYDDDDLKGYEIDSIVIPLYPKIYLESVIAKQLVLEILKDEYLGFQFGTDFVFRFYLTSNRSFKNHITKNSNININLKKTILLTKMPKFIWVSEFYEKDEYNEKEKTALGIIILDATEANQDSIDALIFAGYPDYCISLNENNFVNLQMKFENYRFYDNLN